MDDMTIPVKINGFTQLVRTSDNLDEARAYKLDRYVSTHPRTKKEVEAEKSRTSTSLGLRWLGLTLLNRKGEGQQGSHGQGRL